MRRQIKVFLSYSHKDIKTAARLEFHLKWAGIILTRDIHDLQYTSSIKKFMEAIRTHDFALVLLSQHYFKSSSCLFEINELMKLDDWRNKMLPILVDGQIRLSNKQESNYWEFWENEIRKNRKKLKSQPTDTAKELYIKECLNNQIIIKRFFYAISDFRLLSLNEMIKDGFSPMIRILDPERFEKMTEVINTNAIMDNDTRLKRFEQLINEYGQNSFISRTDSNLLFTAEELVAGRKYLDEMVMTYAVDKSTTFFNIGYAFEYVHRDLEGAIEAYSKAIYFEPSLAIAHYSLGRCLLANKQGYDLAEIYLMNAISLDPTMQEANYKLIELWSGKAKLINIEPYLREIIRTKKNSSAAFLMLGQLLHQRGGFENEAEARELYSKALEISPNMGLAHYGLFVVYLKTYFNIGKAKYHYLEAIRTDPQNKVPNIEKIFRFKFFADIANRIFFGKRGY